MPVIGDRVVDDLGIIAVEVHEGDGRPSAASLQRARIDPECSIRVETDRGRCCGP